MSQLLGIQPQQMPIGLGGTFMPSGQSQPTFSDEHLDKADSNGIRPFNSAGQNYATQWAGQQGSGQSQQQPTSGNNSLLGSLGGLLAGGGYNNMSSGTGTTLGTIGSLLTLL